MTAEGPETEKILIFFFIHSRTTTPPGSDIHGVPASDINEITFLSSSRFMILFKIFFSLNLWLEIKFAFISNLSSNFLDTLVYYILYSV